MTISSTTVRVSYAGDGSTTGFSFPHRFLADADLLVIVVDDSTGDETDQTLTTDYTVSGAGNDNGGTVTMNSAPASGETLIIINDPELTQGTDYKDATALPSDSLENNVDRLTLIAQRTRFLGERSVRFRDGYTGSASPVLPEPEGGHTIGWDSDGDTMVNRRIVALDAESKFVVSDYPDLRSISIGSVPGGYIVQVGGRSSVGDGGEGHFRWDSSDLSTEVGNDEVTSSEGDGGIYVAPDLDKTGASGAWVRHDVGDVYTTWYGAKEDGASDDQASAQKAIDYVNREGSGVVRVTGFSVIGSALIVGSNTNIRGIGADACGWRIADGANDDLIQIDSDVATVDSVSISHMKLDGNRANQTAGSSTINQIGGNGVSRLSVENNRIVSPYDHGVRVTGNEADPVNTQIAIHNNRFEDTGDHSCQLRNTGDCSIRGNLFNDWGTRDALSPAIQTQNATLRLSITDNMFVSSSGEQFAVEAASGIVDAFTFTGNTLYSVNGVGQTGLSGRFNYSTISGNVFRNGGGSNRWGLEIVGHHNSIVGNVIENGQLTVSSSDDGDSELLNVNVSNNLVSNSEDSKKVVVVGRSVSGSVSTVAERVIIANNTIDMSGASGTTPLAIDIGTWGESVIARDIVVSDNFIKGPSNGNGSGIDLSALDGSSLLIVSNNRIENFANGINIPDDNFDDITILNCVISASGEEIRDLSSTVTVRRNTQQSSVTGAHHIARSKVPGVSYRNEASLILEHAGTQHVQLLSPNDGRAQFRWGDPDSDFQGAITYDHALDEMEFRTDGSIRMELDSNTGSTGGSGSAGAGNQYVELKIGGQRYKLLHDGTI